MTAESINITEDALILAMRQRRQKRADSEITTENKQERSGEKNWTGQMNIEDF